ncbi:hypothetical protein NSP_19210 [Nodularia spumigena CCY9414]|nr:hypothetical protein NSP_19210 [Nodularia spumigena CCY9414]
MYYLTQMYPEISLQSSGFFSVFGETNLNSICELTSQRLRYRH